ncbi:hypothetical protein LDENG_00225620 [Lucifuga dentata]|nr:hypothetical protein LDENG_00225620 [Lucifuga dentata]
MATLDDSEETMPGDPPYGKVLLLGAIAAASAFVVTILIVLICVGCQRKSKSKHPAAGEKGTSVNMQGTLQHPKLNSMSKSDTRLHEINRFPCNGNSIPKNRPARGGGGGGEARDHTYTEVGLRNNPTPAQCMDDGLYESVGIRDPKVPSTPPPTSTNTPATTRNAQSPSTQANGAHNGNGNGNGGRGTGRGNGTINGTMRGRGNMVSGINRSPLSSINSLTNQDPTAADYASIRKFRKVDKGNRKESNGADSQSDSQSSVSDSPSAPPPLLHRSQEFPRKPLEPFHLHPFPKEAVFMGNGEQYIWKPPEDDDIITLHPPPHLGENRQGHPSPPTAKEVIADTYSIVCKTQKKKPAMDYNGAKTLPRSFGGESSKGNGAFRGRGRGIQGQTRSHEEPCYEPVGEKSWPACIVAESDPAYATIDTHRKREQAGTNGSTVGGNATLKRKKQLQHQQQAAPVAPQGSGPVRGLPGGENLYETISDGKQGGSSSSTTTIFTFNDGMEMYVTGL